MNIFTTFEVQVIATNSASIAPTEFGDILSAMEDAELKVSPFLPCVRVYGIVESGQSVLVAELTFLHDGQYHTRYFVEANLVVDADAEIADNT
jgi:hypothetical protein